MTRFQKKITHVVLGAFLTTALSLTACWADKKTYVGTIQFPRTIQMLPQIRIYCRGSIIPCELNKNARKITFSIETERARRRFYLLISSQTTQPVKVRKIDPEMEQNTIEYLKVDPAKPYAFYQLDLSVESAPYNPDEVSGEPQQKRKKMYTWRVTEMILPDTGRIPDDAIIVRMNPDYIGVVEGGSGIEFPRIKLRNDVIKIAGSEQKFFDEMAHVLFSSLDIDTLHAHVRQEKRGDLNLKTIIAMAR